MQSKRPYYEIPKQVRNDKFGVKRVSLTIIKFFNFRRLDSFFAPAVLAAAFFPFAVFSFGLRLTTY